MLNFLLSVDISSRDVKNYFRVLRLDFLVLHVVHDLNNDSNLIVMYIPYYGYQNNNRNSRYAEAARKDIFMCIATEKRSISLEFKTNRQPVPSFAAIACNI